MRIHKQYICVCYPPLSGAIVTSALSGDTLTPGAEEDREREKISAPSTIVSETMVMLKHCLVSPDEKEKENEEGV